MSLKDYDQPSNKLLKYDEQLTLESKLLIEQNELKKSIKTAKEPIIKPKKPPKESQRERFTAKLLTKSPNTREMLEIASLLKMESKNYPDMPVTRSHSKHQEKEKGVLTRSKAHPGV